MTGPKSKHIAKTVRCKNTATERSKPKKQMFFVMTAWCQFNCIEMEHNPYNGFATTLFIHCAERLEKPQCPNRNCWPRAKCSMVVPEKQHFFVKQNSCPHTQPWTANRLLPRQKVGLASKFMTMHGHVHRNVHLEKHGNFATWQNLLSLWNTCRIITISATTFFCCSGSICTEKTLLKYQNADVKNVLPRHTEAIQPFCLRQCCAAIHQRCSVRLCLANWKCANGCNFNVFAT